jgi:gliding motility-associated-like protein
MAYPRNPKNPASKSQSNKVCITRETRIFVPDAFNPTSPVQKNRIFSVGSSFVNTSSYEMIIYDRWGAVMFKTNKQDEGWDGTYKGKLVSEGTYIYRIRFENSSGKTEDKRGTFNVIYKD